MSSKCRTCGLVIYNNNPKKLFDDPNNILLSQIEKLTGYWLANESGMPHNICACCITDLSHGLSFLERCLATQKQLKQLRSQSKSLRQNNAIKTTCTTYVDSKTISTELEGLDSIKSLTGTPGYRLSDLDYLIDGTNWKCYTESSDYETVHDIGTRTATLAKSQAVAKPKCDWSKLTEEEVCTRKRQLAIRQCVCERCGKHFNNISNFKQHLVRHSGIKNFKCKSCDKKYYSQHELNLHKRVVHEGLSMYACKFCGETFRRSARRTEHQKTHSMPEFACSYCGKAFYDRYKWRRHESSHSGVRNFHCFDCNQSFLSRSNLQIHCRSKTHQNVAAENRQQDNSNTQPAFL